MGLFDTLLGRTKQVAPNLDALFALPNAAITLDTQLDLKPSTHGGLCFKEGGGETTITSDDEIRQLVAIDTPGQAVNMQKDTLGFNWLLVDDPDIGNLVTKIHGANTTLVENGLGARLLCAVFGFVPKTPPGEGDVKLVYLLKRGTFYPFAPRPNQRRDNELELRVRTFIADDVPIEKDLTHWLALWDVPVA
jgi:hypothetical protein